MTRRMRRPAAVLAASVVAVGGFAAAGALAGIRGIDSVLTTTTPPQPPPTPPPAPTPPPPPPPAPPPAPAVVTPPPAPPPPPPPPPAKPRKHVKHTAKARHRHRDLAVVAPKPWGRGSGGPPTGADWVPPAAPVTNGVLAASTSLTVGRPSSSHAALFLLLAGACGLLLLVGSMLPSPAIRPSLVHNVVVVHRIDLALVGGAIVVLVGILRVVGGG